ncbi:ATP-binding protein [Hyphomicrobium sp. CS1GBMeth3]|uniref:ATP-binding protein n=1 Tax=Hyphomicrobium sp. CS1GBMeth3 TaxID=1892845 RepID=UPI000931F4A8|nr:ATP-binding protein [Hyphomicrobium sp. CS1GBMeth3]
MPARYGVAGCILVVLGLVSLALLAGEGAFDVARTIGPYVLLALVAGIYLAGESRSALRAISFLFRRAIVGSVEAKKQSGADGPAGGLDDQIVRLGNVLKFARAIPVVDRFETVDIPALVTDVIAGKTYARLCLSSSPTRPIFTLASREALTRALEILIENALMSGAARAVLSCDSGTSALVVHVDDDGPGVPKSVRAEVLEWRYHMATPPACHAPCLADVVIARQIARAHRGDVVIGCSPLGGARFTLRLPLVADNTLELAKAS